jgi:glycosyltransferase involved in cell wall biosynthesis
LVPWGVETVAVDDADRDRVRRCHDLPDRFVLSVGTLEPRKNLARLADAVQRIDDPIQLVVVGPDGWGDIGASGDGCRFIGRVDDRDLAAIYDVATVFAYPSLQEGFGLPVAEAMAQGTPVVTSRGTSTEEVAGGAAITIDPYDVDSIAGGLAEALARRDELVALGRARAAELSWSHTVAATIDAYREATA